MAGTGTHGRLKTGWWPRSTWPPVSVPRTLVELAGIPGTTVRTWRREDAEFAALVRQMNDELVSEAVYALGAVSRKAVATLDAGMNGNAKPAQIRAADIVLSRLAPLREFELMRARLEQLEALASGVRGGTW